MRYSSLAGQQVHSCGPSPPPPPHTHGSPLTSRRELLMVIGVSHTQTRCLQEQCEASDPNARRKETDLRGFCPAFLIRMTARRTEPVSPPRHCFTNLCVYMCVRVCCAPARGEGPEGGVWTSLALKQLPGWVLAHEVRRMQGTDGL